jgi:hypothetical protein
MLVLFQGVHTADHHHVFAWGPDPFLTIPQLELALSSFVPCPLVSSSIGRSVSFNQAEAGFVSNLQQQDLLAYDVTSASTTSASAVTPNITGVMLLTDP